VRGFNVFGFPNNHAGFFVVISHSIDWSSLCVVERSLLTTEINHVMTEERSAASANKRTAQDEQRFPAVASVSLYCLHQCIRGGSKSKSPTIYL